jgi:hypothetical protein
VISNQSVWVIIPAYNEAATIGMIISELSQLDFAGILVINDGSKDETSQIANESGAIVLDHVINQGVGAAIRTGLRFLERQGAEWAVQIDADGQHRLESINGMLQKNDCDLVIGQRNWEQYKFGVFRKCAQFALLQTLKLNGVNQINDPTSGFRLFSKRAIKVLSTEMPANFIGDTVEALIISKRHGLRVIGVPVEMDQRNFGKSSHTGPRIVRAFITAFLYSISYKPRRIKND